MRLSKTLTAIPFIKPPVLNPELDRIIADTRREIDAIFSAFTAKQEPPDPEMDRALFENIKELYEE